MRSHSTRLSNRIVFGLLALLILTGLPAAAATYSIDPVHSSAVFKVSHLGASNFYGMFKNVTGTIHYDEANPGAASIEVTIDADSVDTRAEQRDGHVKSPDFLDAKQFPTITFKSSKVRDLGDGKLEVAGKLTLHGVTKDITVSAEKVGDGKNPRSGAELIGFEAHFTVDRTDHDMTFMAGPLGKEIHFILSVEAGKE